MAEVRPSLRLGKYRLIIELAQGGMGCVYLAVAEGPAGFSKLTVIKELKRSLVEEPGFLEMFLDEARLSARLSHPNVVQTNEVSVEAGKAGAWLAMEYLDGQSLVRVRARMTRLGKLPLPVHLRIIAEACHGLHYAQELRDFDGTPLHVVHRDVSPHNVFVTYDGQVKIVDFGIAKAMSSNHETSSGVMKGKLPYMAPEQLLGTVVDRRLDVFSVGVMLFEAVANRRFWEKVRPETIMGRLMSGDVPRLAEACPTAPPRLVALVDRATAPHPDHRYPTMEALRSDLELCIAELGGADQASLRDFGRQMAEAFTDERARVHDAIQGQLRLLRDPAPAQSLTLLAISQSGPTGEYGAQRPSGAASLPPTLASAGHGGTAILPTVAVPMDGSAGTGKTGSPLALAHSHPPPAARGTPRPMLTAAVAFVTVVATAGTLAVVVGKKKTHEPPPESPPAVVDTNAPAPPITASANVVTTVSTPLEPPRAAPDAMAPAPVTSATPPKVGPSPRGPSTATTVHRGGTTEGRKPPTNEDPDLGY